MVVRYLTYTLPDVVQVPVWAVLDYTETRTIARELLLVKVSILGPEYLEDQLVGGPSHDPRVANESTPSMPPKAERERTFAHHFEHSADPDQLSESNTIAITPSEALRLKHLHMQSISVLANQFGAKIVDVSEHSVIVELTAKTSRVEAFLSLVKPFGILEAARTGMLYVYPLTASHDNLKGLMAMPRTPITTSGEEDVASDLGGVIDASLLPPG